MYWYAFTSQKLQWKIAFFLTSPVDSNLLRSLPYLLLQPYESIAKCVNFRGTLHTVFNELLLWFCMACVFPSVCCLQNLSQSSHILLELSGLIILKQVGLFSTICCFMQPHSGWIKILAGLRFMPCSRFHLVEELFFMEVFFTKSGFKD